MTPDQATLKERLKKKYVDDVASNDEIEDDEPPESQVNSSGQRGYLYTSALKRKKISRDSEEYINAITTSMLWLRLNRPYYGFIIDEMSQRITRTTPTAHVEISGTNVIMAMNPDFMALLPMRHRAGVIMHECLHVMSLHITRIKESIEKHGQWVKRIANAAADIAVNDLIADSRDLPKSALMSNKFKIPDKKDQVKNWKCFPARQTYEYYVELFKQIGEDEMQRQIDAMCQEAIAADGGGLEDGNILDDHGPWMRSTADFDVDLVNELIRDKVRNATMRATARGVGAGDLQDLVDKLIANKSVDFGVLFQGIIGRHIAQVRRPSMLRPSKRYGQPPGRVTARRLEVRYYQDTSGSMAIEEIKVGLSEAAHAEESGLAHVTVQQFDWALQGPPITPRDMGKINVGVKGRGGTSLRDVIDDIDRHQPDLVFIATDGGLEHNLKPKSGVPVVWLLTAHGVNPGWGQVLRMPTLADIMAGQKAKALRSRT